MSDYPFEHPEHLGRNLAKHLATGVITAVVVAAGLGALYVIAPVPEDPWSLTEFALYVAICLVVFLGVTILAIVRLSRTSRPLITGLLFVVIMGSVLILSYSWLYLSMSSVDPSAFTEPLNKAGAVYFTVTILTTVGFGDITPVGDTSRLVVTSQMLVGLAVLTVAIKAVTATTSRVIKRKHSSTAHPDGGHDDQARPAPASS